MYCMQKSAVFDDARSMVQMHEKLVPWTHEYMFSCDQSNLIYILLMLNFKKN